MLEMLSFDFMQNALLAGILVSLACGVMGSFVVVNRLSGLAGGIAHASYGGVGLACFFGFSPLIGSFLFAVGSALLMGFLTVRARDRADTLIGVIWAFGMALGVIFADKTSGYSGDMMGFLFGSILTVPTSLLISISILLILILSSVFIFYRKLLSVSFDPEFAAARGERVFFYYMLLVVLIAMTVVMAVQAVGLILVIALLTLPAFMAEAGSKSLISMMIKASIISLFLVVMGLLTSYSMNLTAGPVIILFGVFFYLIHLAYRRLFRSR